MTDWPHPEHTSRQPWPEGFKQPSAAVTLRDMAIRHGWRAELTYARGHVPGVGDRRNLVHSVAVRFVRDGRLGYVVYEARADRKLDWVAKTFMVSGRDHWPVSVGLGVTDVKTYLVESQGWTGAQVAAWGQACRLRLTEQKVAQKAAAKARPKKAKVHA